MLRVKLPKSRKIIRVGTKCPPVLLAQAPFFGSEAAPDGPASRGRPLRFPHR